MTAMLCWLDDLDAALVGDAAAEASEERLDALIDQGVTLFSDPSTIAEPLDPTVLARVQQRLRTIADQVAAELDAVRGERRELTRVGRAHAGYQAAAAP